MTLSSSSSILIIASSSTGNNIFCTPAIRLLRKHLPNAKLDVIALNKLSAEVFAENPDINRVYVMNKSRHVNKIANQYNHLLALNNNALKKLNAIKTSLIQAPPFTDAMHHAEHLLQFVASLLNVELAETDHHYVLKTNQILESVLPNGLINPRDILINIHLGCGTTVLHGWKFFYAKRADDKKLWSIEAYIALGNALLAAIPNLRLAITGTSNESFLAKKFEKSVPNTINLVGKTTVSDLCVLMARANLFIAHDCGVFHVASASNVPIVGLFGPTNPVATGPYPIKPQHIIIKKRQMADISTDEVVVAAKILLNKFVLVEAA